MDLPEQLDKLRAQSRTTLIEQGIYRIQVDGFGNLHLQRIEKKKWLPVCGTKDTEMMLDHWKRKTGPETA